MQQTAPKWIECLSIGINPILDEQKTDTYQLRCYQWIINVIWFLIDKKKKKEPVSACIS